MPQMDGFGVLEQVQRIPPEQRPRVIALTALGREDFVARALRLGVTLLHGKAGGNRAS